MTTSAFTEGRDTSKIAKITGLAAAANRHFRPSTCVICAVSRLHRIAMPPQGLDLRRSHFTKSRSEPARRRRTLGVRLEQTSHGLSGLNDLRGGWRRIMTV
ncbi:hypothetical protein BD410DRAFT_795428 [Rickenella mellea]|uniref:Uncharacterized protein n=1 Tax=Rickenella mellea TaxID=50990 RepID=A0A4Y7PMR7_9AGAM|nr:hypothetical protein BD410DRAFT_795428 [Rickenella mellea]